jgi:hypothetical protein
MVSVVAALQSENVEGVSRMRLITVGLGIAALLATSVASAAPQGGGAGQKGDTGGKGGLGPEGSTQAGAAGSAEQGGSVDTSLTQFGRKGEQDKATGKVVEEKPWEISGIFETHHLLEQNFLTTYAGLKTFNVYVLAGRYNITQNDTVAISGGAQQWLQADQGETGFRLFDLTLGYTHRFQLPEKFNLATSGALTAPISYSSQLASNITTPSLGVTLSRRFGDLTVALNLRGAYFWDKYTSPGSSTNNAGPQGQMGTESVNPKFSAGGAITAEYSMPFHRPLSAGIALTDSYLWLYQVGQPPAGTQFMGATTYPNQDGQPFMQSYGGEIFARYIIPDLAGFKSDITLALANGDPSLGYPSLLHDGVVHPYVMYYNTAEVYLAFEGRY